MAETFLLLKPGIPNVDIYHLLQQIYEVITLDYLRSCFSPIFCFILLKKIMPLTIECHFTPLTYAANL